MKLNSLRAFICIVIFAILPMRSHARYVDAYPNLSEFLSNIEQIVRHLQEMAVNDCEGDFDFMNPFETFCGYSTIYNPTRNYVSSAALRVNGSARYIEILFKSPIIGTALPPGIAGKKLYYSITEHDNSLVNPTQWACTTNIDEMFMPIFKSMNFTAGQTSIISKVKLRDVSQQRSFQGCTYAAVPFA